MILSHKQTDEVFTNTLESLELFNVEHRDEIYRIFSSFRRTPLTFTKEKGYLYFENENVRFTFNIYNEIRVKSTRVTVNEISNLGYHRTVLGLDISSDTVLFDRNKTVKFLLEG